MSSSHAPSGAFRRWFLETDTPEPEGFYEGEQEVQHEHHTTP